MLTTIDVLRPPQRQVTSRIYLSALDMYQQYGRQALEGTIRCRYVPTCSEYSRQAVGRHGLAGGLKLTFIRIHSCTTEVQPATPDPPPM
jgi:putative component of membrane protein insertase Oxa1/YidC/SpoIIIJ protein YidD